MEYIHPRPTSSYNLRKACKIMTESLLMQTIQTEFILNKNGVSIYLPGYNK